LTVGSFAVSAAENPQNQFWKDPQFIAEFIGSYGVKSDVEPPMSQDDQLFYRELAGIIATNQLAAIERLSSVLAEGKTIVQPPAPPEPEDGGRRKKSKLPDPVEITLQNPASFWFTLGNLQVSEGMTDAAQASYQKAIETFPDFLRAHKNMGVLLVQNGKFEEALGSLLKALELGGNDGNLYGLLGACFLSTSQNRSAELAYNQAMVLTPGKKDWQLGAARALLYQGRYHEAGALFGELIQKEPGVAQYWLFQANCFIGLNEPMKAAYNYEMVRELGAIDAGMLSALGDIYLSRDLKDLALDTYVAAFEKDPDGNLVRAVKSAEVLAARRATSQSGKLIAAIHAKLGNDLDAEQQLRLLRLESKLALANGEDAEAAKIMEELIQREPMDGEIMLLLAGYYGRTDKVAEAEAMYERAARLTDYEADAQIKHAQLLVKQKSYDRAVKLLRSALAIEPKENIQRYLEGVLKVQAATRS
jgi:Flp pilus assembly protein TadD